MGYVDLFSQAELRARIGLQRLKQALDDDNDGTIDAEAEARLIRDASSYVLEGYYVTFDAVPDPADIVEGLKRLALDAAEAYLARRAQEVIRLDWEKLFRWIDSEIDKLKKAERKLGASPPDPAANHGGEVMGNDPDCDEPPEFFYLNGTGIF